MEFENGDINVVKRLSHEFKRYLMIIWLWNLRMVIISFQRFWRAEEVIGERGFLLTIRNQPFVVRGDLSDDNLFRYRTKMHDVIVNGDATIGRVFLNNRMEFTPNVSYYSDKEYPQRDIALSCDIQSSLVLPWCDISGSVVGAMEIVTDWKDLTGFENVLSTVLCRNSLYSDYCRCLCGQYDLENDSFISAMSEIKEVIREVFESGNAVYPQIWMLCKRCNYLRTAKRFAKELGALFKNFIDIDEDSLFLEYQRYCKLQKGEGVVGKAAESSHSLVYCEDISKFSITEYPLAHCARHCELSASFAICLKSNQTGDQVYVIEFFLLPDYVRGKNIGETLVPMLKTMRQCFKTFKFASGAEMGDSLSVQVIDASLSERIETLEIGELDLMDDHLASSDSVDNGKDVVNTTVERDLETTLFGKKCKSFVVTRDTKGDNLAIGVSNTVVLQQPGQRGNAENMVSDIDERNIQIDTQSYADDPGRDLAGGVINVVHTDKNGVGSSDECIISQSKLPNQRGGIDISLEELMQVVGMNREDAARHFDVSISTFKRACRHHGISRWPPRKRNIDNQSCSGNCTSTSTRKTRKLSAPAVQNQSPVKIKAHYKDICLKFDISASSGIDVFHYQVSKRLKLVAGDYTIKYLDEDNDWIIIACNEDLHDYISSPILLARNNLLISLDRV